MPRLTKTEQETFICFNEEETLAQVETCNAALKRKLDKLCQRNSEIVLLRQDEYSKTYRLPKKWVKIHAPRVLSEEQKTKQREILAAIKNNRPTNR